MQRAQVRAVVTVPGTLSPVMRRTLSPARVARRLVPLAAAAAALGLSGCQLTNPLQTTQPYTPADGVAVDLSQVQIRDLVVVAEKKGGPGTLSGSVVNRGGQQVSINFAGEGGATADLQVPAYATERLSGTNQVSLSTVNAEPGGVTTLQVTTQGAGTNIVQVPVVAAQGYYQTLAPTSAPTSSPSSSPTSTPSTTATSSPTS